MTGRGGQSTRGPGQRTQGSLATCLQKGDTSQRPLDFFGVRSQRESNEPETAWWPQEPVRW